MVFGQTNSLTRLTFLFVLGCLWAVAARGQTNLPPAFAPVPVSAAPTKALQIVGSNLFVAAWGSGVQVLDISDPARPKWKGAWNPRRCPMGIHVVGDYAYVANRRAGLSVLDVRNPANPVMVGSVGIPNGDAQAVNVAGRYAYVADYPTGFRIIDIKDPTRPVLLGTGSMPQAARSIHAVSGYAFCTEPNGFHVFDVRDPRKPVRVGGRKIPGSVSRVQIVGHHAYLATGQTGLLILDLTHPAVPLPVDRLMIETNDLPIVTRNPNGFSQSGFTWMLTNATFRAILEQRYSTNLPDIKEIVAALRESPFYYEYVGRHSGISRYLHGLHIMDRYALALSGGLEVIDVSDGNEPKRVGACQTGGATWDVRGAGRYAYVMDNGANIRVIDLGDPVKPVTVAHFNSCNYGSRILAVSEAEKPATPTPVETYPDVPVVADAPELSDPQCLPDGAFAFTLSGIGHATYVIHATADLVSWVAISTNTLPADGRLRITDPAAVTRPHQFYRAVMQ